MLSYIVTSSINQRVPSETLHYIMKLKSDDIPDATHRHNTICSLLRSHNPYLSDEQKFHIENLDWHLKGGMKHNAIFCMKQL